MIESVRVAAYSLLAPEQLHGSLQIQSDLVGAAVSLDGKSIGKTPLANQGVLRKLALGPHKLHVEARDYAPFDDTVEVHFQKVSPVVVRLVGSGDIVGTGRTVHEESNPIYERTWFIIAVGVAAIAAGAAVGYFAGHHPCKTYHSDTMTFTNGC